ncbi:Gfo/Idh/MocA family protein [Rothia sp. ZJ932]|uniref:Gfo/Idh/MocA family protein n=1 Tax=Rothia sp. ZJ932 TaxID=2810516 RepID=UPI0019681692|nr:Gfo/Idh/MocA family oxidoreductase [Rothia sp. ZJ932]QRZ61482.1 Gfo/Idh/MocA family oxidoreductase [Rothia sp. ZJ932]
MSNELRVAVVGAGRMGFDHIKRIESDRIKGARVVAVVDINEEVAQRAVEGIEDVKIYTDFHKAIESKGVDAVLIATPGFLHAPVLMPAIEAGLPVLCEKPLTPDSASSWEIVQAEVEADKKLVQVGFMRRFDGGYRTIRAAVESGLSGELLQLECEHINPDVPESYTGRNLIDDTVVHEFDGVRFLTGEEIKTVRALHGKKSKYATGELQDPAKVIMETESGILVTVNTHVTSQYGYSVTTKAIFEDNHLSVGNDLVNSSFEPRFVDAYDQEVQAWVDAALKGEQTGPSAWDGYAAAACCEAGLAALESGEAVAVELNEKPDLYK